MVGKKEVRKFRTIPHFKKGGGFMSVYVRHHFIPQFILKRFSHKNEINKKNKLEYFIRVVNNFTLDIESVNTKDAYMIKNLYDYDDGVTNNIKKLEKDFNSKLEQKVVPIIEKLVTSENIFKINRIERMWLKKYTLSVLYRTETNMSFYLQENTKNLDLYSRSAKLGESRLDLWKRELRLLLDLDFDDLMKLEKSTISLSNFAKDTFLGYLTIMKSSENEEFIISDVGKVLEMVVPKEKKPKQKMQKMLKDRGITISEEELAKVLKENGGKITNFTFYPVSPNFAIVLVNQYREGSFFTDKHFPRPHNHFVNHQEIKKKSYITPELRNNEDKYEYDIVKLSSIETIYINILTLNESKKNFTFKIPSKIIDSVRCYNKADYDMVPNVKNNFKGLVEIVSNLKD